MTLETVPAAVQGFLAIANGVTVEPSGLLGDPARCATDLRVSEGATLALADHVPAARQAEVWFFTKAEGGTLLRCT